MYERPKEVLALARLRHDRDEGDGMFDSVEAFVFGTTRDNPTNGEVASLLDRICGQAMDEAERDIADVMRAIPGIALPQGASDWLLTLQGPERPTGWTFGNVTRQVLPVMAECAKGGPGAEGFQASGHEGEERLDFASRHIPTLAHAMRFLEVSIRQHGVEAEATCIAMDLRPDADGKAMGHYARLFGQVTAPSKILVCLIGLRDGTRSTLLMPDGNERLARQVSYCDEGPLEEAYAVQAEAPTDAKVAEPISKFADLGIVIHAAADVDASVPIAGIVARGADGQVSERFLPPMGFVRALALLERELVEADAREAAVCTVLSLRTDILDGVSGLVGRLFHGDPLPRCLALSVAGNVAGERIMVAQPRDDASLRRELSPIEADLIQAAYEPAVRC